MGRLRRRAEGSSAPARPPSRASPLPQGSLLERDGVFDAKTCGSGLAREEAIRNTSDAPR
ncbi:hypothetical protein C1X12_22330 [Pseudomonas sp. FW305-60]|nr:hypothetical protein C1X12_22330 [Pseudomonas sp. FW305-60]